jgi:pheromone shutdown protein TraB
LVDLKKACDLVTLADVIDWLREREVPEQIVRIIKEVKPDTVARIKSNNQTSRPIKITNDVRQGDSLSPMLFNIIIDKIIANLTKELGYRMGSNTIQVICYAEDAGLIAESEENLEILLLKFDEIAENLNMKIALRKTKVPDNRQTQHKMRD